MKLLQKRFTKSIQFQSLLSQYSNYLYSTNNDKPTESGNTNTQQNGKTFNNKGEVDQNSNQKKQNQELQKEDQIKFQHKNSIYDLKTAQKYIRDNIRKFDWSTYVVSNYYPSKIRDAFLTINYYNIELMRIPENTKEASLAHGKLEFWNDSINQIFADQPMKEPVSICLHDACKNNPIPKGILLRLINARKIEVENPHLADLNQMVQIAEQIRTNLIYLNLCLLRIDYNKYPQLIKCAELVGRCLGILDYVKRVPFTLRKYRLYMPEDIMRKYSVNVRNLWDRVEGKPKDDLFDVILEVTAFAKKCLDESKQYQKDLPPHAFRAMLHAVEAEYYLKFLESINFDVFNRSINSNSYIQLPMHVWRAAKNKTYFIDNK